MVANMGLADIEKRRKSSKVPQGPMWKDWWEEAAMKTVLRNLSKYLPMSSDLDDLIRRDDPLYDFDSTAAERPKLSDVGSALDHFSQPARSSKPDQPSGPQPSSQPDPTSEPIPPSNPEKESEPSPPSNPNPSSEPTSASKPEAPSDPEAEKKAFDQGVNAKKNKIGRRAVPPEYRTPETTNLARAWIQGWDAG